MLDFAAKLDSAADYIFQADRANLEYPPPFGRDATEEEAKIREMDSKTGASLKVHIFENTLNETHNIFMAFSVACNFFSSNRRIIFIYLVMLISF